MSEEVGEGADANADSEEDGSGGGDDDTKLDNNDHEEEDLQHEAEDIHDLEVARKERMDLMEVELSSGEKKGAAASVERKTMATDGKEEEEKEKLPPMEKFQYLIGQSEVFAHFLAGELETIDGVGSLCYSCSLSWVHVNSL